MQSHFIHFRLRSFSQIGRLIHPITHDASQNPLLSPVNLLLLVIFPPVTFTVHRIFCKFTGYIGWSRGISCMNRLSYVQCLLGHLLWISSLFLNRSSFHHCFPHILHPSGLGRDCLSRNPPRLRNQLPFRSSFLLPPPLNRLIDLLLAKLLEPLFQCVALQLCLFQIKRFLPLLDQLLFARPMISYYLLSQIFGILRFLSRLHD